MFNNPILNNIAPGTQDIPNIGGEKNLHGKDSPFSQTLDKIISPQNDNNNQLHKQNQLGSDVNKKNIVQDNGIDSSEQSPSPLKKLLKLMKTNNVQRETEDIEKEIEGFINNKIVEKVNLLLEEKGIEGINIRDFINSNDISEELEFILGKEGINTENFFPSNIIDKINLFLEEKGIEGIKEIEIQDFINGEISKKLEALLNENGAKVANLTNEDDGVHEKPDLFTARDVDPKDFTGKEEFLEENFVIGEEVKKSRPKQGKELTEGFKTAGIEKEGYPDQLNMNEENLPQEKEGVSLKDAVIDKEVFPEPKTVSDKKEIKSLSNDTNDTKDTRNSLTKEMLDKKFNDLDINKKVSGEENKSFNQTDEEFGFNQKAISDVGEIVSKRVSAETSDAQQKTRDISLGFESEKESKKIDSLEMKNKDMDMGMDDSDGFMKDVQKTHDIHSGSKSIQNHRLDSTVLDQIIDKMKKPVFNLGKNEMKLSLKPEFLGEVKMDISIEKNVFRADVTVDNSMVKDILDGNLDKLKQSLESQGLQMEKFSVSVGHDQGSQQAGYKHSGRKGTFFGFNPGTVQESAEYIPSRNVMENGRLDLLI